jgi:hypothetical protein
MVACRGCCRSLAGLAGISAGEGCGDRGLVELAALGRADELESLFGKRTGRNIGTAAAGLPHCSDLQRWAWPSSMLKGFRLGGEDLGPPSGSASDGLLTACS